MAGLTILDEYDRTARLAPGLYMAFPIPLIVIVLGLQENPTVTGLIALGSAIGLPLALAGYVRSHGQALQDMLYQKWGGSPTTLLLTRPAPSDRSDALRELRRREVERVTNMRLPDTPLPHSASTLSQFEAAVTILRQKTYNHTDFPMVFNENKTYGYNRNLRALRTSAIALHSLGIVVAATGAALAIVNVLNFNATALIFAAVVLTGTVAWWATWPTEDRVQKAGYQYATQLLDATVEIQSS